MGFSSQDDLISEVTVAGKYRRLDWFKNITPAHTAGAWHLLSPLAGSPPATAMAGSTSLLWQHCDENIGDGAAANFSLLHGGPVLADTKHVLNASVGMVAAAGAPAQVLCVDMMGYYKLSGADVTGTGSRSLINANTFTASSSTGLLLTYTNDFISGTKVRFTTTGTLPSTLSLNTDYWLIRQSPTTSKVATSYANYVAGTYVEWGDAGSGTHTMTARVARGDGVGCQAFFAPYTAPTLGGPTLSASSYTNAAGTAGRAFQGVPTMVATPAVGRIAHSAPATANSYGWVLPMQGGDTGVKSIESFTWSAGTAYTGSGTFGLFICRPLFYLPIVATGLYAERDFVNQLPSLPQIPDGACLQFLMLPAGATTNLTTITGHLDVAWG